MKSQKPISKPLFLIYMAVSLLAIAALWGMWLWRETGPYAWLQHHLTFWGQRESQVVGATLAFMLLFVLWLAPTLALRRFSDMPSLGPGSARDFRTALHAQRKTHDAMLAQPADAPERARYFRYMGWVGVGVGIVALLITGVVWYLDEALWVTGWVVALVGVLGGLLAVLSGRPVIFDTVKIDTISTVVRKIGMVVVVMTLVFATGMCVITSLSR